MRKKTEMPETEFTTKTEILADLWMNYREDEEFLDFIAYNDLGLPLAYAVTNRIVKSTPVADELITETWNLLLSALEIESDEGYDSLDDLLGWVT